MISVSCLVQCEIDVILLLRNSVLLYSNHYRSVFVPAQQGILSIPRLCILDISPSLEKVFMLHDTSEFSGDGAIDGFIYCEVGREQNIEESLMDLRKCDVSKVNL